MSAKPRILLVDDEPFILSMMRSFLDERQFDISTASCGNDAIELIRAQPFDCVVSDVRMPNGTGFQLLGWIRDIHPVHPVLIFVTGYSDIPADELLAKGADTYIAKPFNVGDFANEVTRMTKPLRERLSGSPDDQTRGKVLRLQGPSFEALTKSGGPLRLGRGGMFVPMSTDGIKLYQALAFEVALADGGTFSGTGRVLWMRKSSSLNPMHAGLGIVFETLDPGSIDRFVDFVEKEKPIEVIPRDL